MRRSSLRSFAVSLAVPLALALPIAACSDPEVESVGWLELAGRVCADGVTTEGIDVSVYQGTIDWDAIASQGIKYAFIRANHGLGTTDTQFERNWSEARRVGVMRGAYQYFMPDEDPADQAQLMMDIMGPLEADDLPPVVDIENNDGGLSQSAVQASLATWIDLIEAGTGRRPIIYTAKYFWQDEVGMPDTFLDHPLWVANYTTDCPLIADPWTRWSFWQYTSSAVLDGITVNTVDRDQFNGDETALASFIAASQLCGDGTCDASEAASCPADCECPTIPATGGIVDERSGCFEATGTQTSWRIVDAGYDGSLRWTYAWSDPDDNTGTWQLSFDDAGSYQVEVHTPAPYGTSRQAKYVVTHAGATDTVTLDQSAADGWQALGTWSFAAGGDQAVKLGDSTGEPYADRLQVVWDAIRLTRLDLPSTPDAGPSVAVDGGNPGDPGGGSLFGCAITPVIAPGAASGSAGALGLALAIAALAAVFRRRA